VKAVLLLLLRDAQVRRKFEKSAVQLAAPFDWPVVAGQFAEVLQRIASGISTGPRANDPVPVDR
jgi:hypothetical protein